MALIRVTQASEGIEDYLETGSKQGREFTRTELDKRVALYGDLTSFRIAGEYSRKEKDWKNHYWHITNSFSYEDNQISKEKLTEIVQEMLAYYCCAYDIDKEVIAYAEAHYPKHQSIENKQNNKLTQRLLHIHLAISKVNRLTDLQLRVIPFNTVAEHTFQRHLNLKFNLIDPSDRKRKQAVTKKDFFSRIKGDTTEKKTTIGHWRDYFVELLNQVDNLNEIEAILLAHDEIRGIKYRNNKDARSYLQVLMNDSEIPAINLRGTGFERLEVLYSERDENTENTARDVIASIDINSASTEELKAIFTKHMNWHKSDINRRMADVTNINFQEISKYFKTQYQQFITNSTQKTFHVTFAKQSAKNEGDPEKGSQRKKGGTYTKDSNVVQSLLAQMRDQQYFKQRKAAGQSHNEKAPAEEVIKKAGDQLGLITGFFQVSNNQIIDKRLKGRVFSNTEFLHDICNLEYAEVDVYCKKIMAEMSSTQRVNEKTALLIK